VNIKKTRRKVSKETKVYYDKIASGNAVQKDAKKRDALLKQHSVIAVEMESAGVNTATKFNDNGYLAIRCICDYCDESKNDDWHNYAAATAAVYTVVLLKSIHVNKN